MDKLELLAHCLERGYTVIPLGTGTKRPLVKWNHLRERAATPDEIKYWFAHYPRADIGLVTGPASGLMVLDFDAPPYLQFMEFTKTPSGGRHYFFERHADDRHGLGVRPKLDIPWIVKLYDLPKINPGRIPIQPAPRTEREVPQAQWLDEEPPAFEALQECAFVEWFNEQKQDPNWDGRYPLARAYASNASCCTNADLGLGPDYRHEEDIYAKLARPIRCTTIVSCGFNCPHFDFWTDSCKKAPGITTPYGLAKRLDPP